MMHRLRSNFWRYCGYSAALNLLFVVVYGGANFLADRAAQGMPLVQGLQPGYVSQFQFNWELALPFVPGFIFVYYSISLLLLAPLITLERRELKPFAQAFAWATVTAGFVFVLHPMRLGFERPKSVAGYEVFYAALYDLDLPYNMAPSLHVAYSCLTVLAAARGKARWVHTVLWLWLAAIVASVLLTHQHHIIDAITGLMLGYAYYFAYLRWCSKTRNSASPFNAGSPA